MTVWIHKYAAQPVLKHPGHGDQAVHTPQKGPVADRTGGAAGGGGGAGSDADAEVARMKEGKAIANSISAKAYTYERGIEDRASRSQEDEVDMRNMREDIKDASSFAREGDFKAAAGRLDTAIDIANRTPMTGLVRHLNDARRDLNRLAMDAGQA